MATSSAAVAVAAALSSSSFLSANSHPSIHRPFFPTTGTSNPQIRRRRSNKPISFQIKAAKLPAGVILPKVEPKFSPPFLGFTKTAEIWNSRACMIGLIGTFIVELILNKGILEIIGVEVGKGLDLPL